MQPNYNLKDAMVHSIGKINAPLFGWHFKDYHKVRKKYDKLAIYRCSLYLPRNHYKKDRAMKTRPFTCRHLCCQDNLVCTLMVPIILFDARVV